MSRRAMLEWSKRRLLGRARYTWQLFRLMVDWIIAVYIVVPGMAIALWLLWRYYTGQFTHGFTPSTLVHFVPRLPGIEFHSIVFPLVTAALIAIHVIFAAYLPIALETGDKAFVLLSPVRRETLLQHLWMESLAFTLFPILAFGILALPLVEVSLMSAPYFIAFLAVEWVYLSTIRFIGQTLAKRGDEFSWRRWWLAVLFRLVSYFPAVLTLSWMTNRGAPLMYVVLFAGFALITSFAIYQQAKRSPLDSYFRVRLSFLVQRTLARVPDSMSQIHFYMKKPSKWVVRTLERTRRRKLHPVTWLILIRLFRRKNMIRDIFWLSAAVVSCITLMRGSPVILIALGFCSFMVMQWWNIVVKPMYKDLVERQTMENEWTLKSVERSLQTKLVFVLTAIWLALWWLLIHS